MIPGNVAPEALVARLDATAAPVPPASFGCQGMTGEMKSCGRYSIDTESIDNSQVFRKFDQIKLYFNVIYLNNAGAFKL